MSRIWKHKKLLASFQTVLFDLDGTLFDSELFYKGVFEDMGDWLVQKGVLPGKDQWTACMMGQKSARGVDYSHLVDDGLRFMGLPLSLKSGLISVYHNHDCRHIYLDEPEAGCLAFLKQAGKTLCLVTNGRTTTQELKINRLGLYGLMDRIIILDPMAGDPLKPDPAAFERLQEETDKGTAIMVGDRFDIDGLFAKNAGIEFLCVGFYGD